MHWHLLAYEQNQTSSTNNAADMVPDGVLTRRNNRLISTDPLDLIGAAAMGSGILRARFNNIGLITRGIPHIWPVIRSATVPDRPGWMDLRQAPVALPVNEEIVVEITDNAVAAADNWVLLWLAGPGYSRNQQRGAERLTVRATATGSGGSETTWGNLVDLTFERDLIGGVWSVRGVECVAPNCVAFRFRFPRQPETFGRQWRPGGLVTNATGNVSQDGLFDGFGEWGRFNTYEPPQVQFLGDAAGVSAELFLHLEFLGQANSLLERR